MPPLKSLADGGSFILDYLPLKALSLRTLSPVSVMQCAVWIIQSSIASATLESPIALYQSSSGRQIVGGLRCVFVRGVVAVMRCHMGEAMEDVDCVGVKDHIHSLAHILDRHAVMALVECYVAIALDGGYSTLSHLIAVRGQWPQTAPLNRIEELTA